MKEREGKGKRKKEWKERKKERKEGKGRGGSRRWPAVIGGGRSWPEKAAKAPNPNQLWGASVVHLVKNGVLETRCNGPSF